MDATKQLEEDWKAIEQDLVEVRRVRRRVKAGSRKLATTKRTPPAKRMKAKRYYRRKKIKLKLRRKKKMRSPKFRRRTKMLARRAAARRGEDVDTLIDQMWVLVEG